MQTNSTRLLLRVAALIVSIGSASGCEPESAPDDGGAMTRRDSGTMSRSDGAVITDAGTRDATVQPGTDGGPPPTGSVPVFMLVGHLGRLMMTCDGADSWAFDDSEDNVAHCWDMGAPGPECDHHTWAANGITYGNGLFVATFGWGDEGVGHGLYVGDGSTGGAGFTEAINGSYNGVAYGRGAFVGGSGRPAVSTDDGESFRNLDAIHYDTPRGAFFADVMGGRHVIYADGPRILVSDDGAETFFEPDAIAGACGNLGVGGNGVMILYAGDSTGGCRSADGGVTWSAFSFPGNVQSRGVFTGTEMWVFGGGNRYASADGMTWTTLALSPSSVRFHHVARDAEGTLLGIYAEWGSYYTDSSAWRSTDGINWEHPAASDGVNGHPIRGITAGFAPASACD